MTIFRHYDQAALDREYDNRAKVPDFPQYVERWNQRSKQAREQLDCRLDIQFGPSSQETLDVFFGEQGSPVQVFIHGGYWISRHKDDFSFVVNGFQDSGATTVVINYALIPSVTMDELVRQCRAAVAWVWRNISEHGGDANQVYISGHSAGGHLVAMLMATDWPTFESGLPNDLIKGGCGISGLYDLEPIRLCYLNDDLQLSTEAADRNSPVQLQRHSKSSLLLPVGELEGPEYLRQSEDLAAAWRNQGSVPEVKVMPGQDHFSIVGQLDDPSSELSRTILQQMGLA